MELDPVPASVEDVLLVGEGALRFARMHGFKEENILTDAARCTLVDGVRGELGSVRHFAAYPDRDGRLADGWVTDLQTSDDIIHSIERIQAWRREFGRENTPFEVMATPSDAWDVDGYRRLEDAGVTHILTMPWPFYHGESELLEHKIDGIKRYADDIISRCG